MTVLTYTPYCTATLNGVQLPPTVLKGARVEASFADPVSRGYVKCIGGISWSPGDSVTIALGSGAHNMTRFSGTVLQGDYLNSGPTFELVCRGPMYAVQKYRNNRPNGILLADLTGGPATDEDIAKAVLNEVGVSYSAGNIGGTGIVRGGTAAVAYTWRRGESALEYLQRLSKASLGYKMVESTDGNINNPSIYRVPVLSRPGGGVDVSLTEGADIFEGGHTQIEEFDTYSAWEVTGFDYGDGLGPVHFSYPSTLSSGTAPYAYSSEMIERDTDVDPRTGISAETVLGYIRGESDHAITKISGLQTPRDDLIGPGQIHSINAPMLGLSGNYTCIGVTVEADDQWFVQTMEYVG